MRGEHERFVVRHARRGDRMRVVMEVLVLDSAQVLGPVERRDMVLSCLVLLDVLTLQSVDVGQVGGGGSLHCLGAAGS